QCSSAYARFSSACLEIHREHVRGFDRIRRCEPRADRLATASESCEVVKCNAASQKHARILFERAVDLDRDSALCGSQRRELCDVVSIVLNNSHTLRDEWR